MARFSICLPVRNGMPYIEKCVQSILNQSYKEFELHILDNHSTDGTTQWLKTLEDQRIRLSFSDRPLSIVESWGRIKYIPKQEFVTLIGHDDILDPEFLLVISKLIEGNPDAALYQTGGRLIDSNDQVIRTCKRVPLKETGADYLRSRFGFKRDIFGTGYVMRSADYDRLGGIPSFEKLFFADDALWLSLMRGSYKVCDQTECFAVRIHSRSESASLPSAWAPILIGLKQFVSFLNHSAIGDLEVQKVLEDQAPNFFLAYHRNAAIFALIEASQAGMRIQPEVVIQINRSLMQCAPASASRLWMTPTLSVLRVLNATRLRFIMPALWKFYCLLKTKVHE